MGDDTICIPAERAAEMARQQALLDSDPRVLAPEGVDVDVWTTIDEAAVDDVRWEDGDLHVWLETTTPARKCVARATRRQPAEYRTDELETLVTISWDLDPENDPSVDIEVLS